MDNVETKEAPKVVAPVFLDTVTVWSDVNVTVHIESPAISGLRIDLEHLGVATKPVKVEEGSGNGNLLDLARPPVMEDDSNLLVFFKNPIGPGNYTFTFRFSYTDDAEPVNPEPLLDGKYNGVHGKKYDPYKPPRTPTEVKKAEGKKS